MGVMDVDIYIYRYIYISGIVADRVGKDGAG